MSFSFIIMSLKQTFLRTLSRYMLTLGLLIANVVNKDFKNITAPNLDFFPGKLNLI